ncbi:phospholipase D-like domain-containing protein [Salinisphaera sp. LB1]|uniref:phospholipase D-like domain-containing protein n=1 Tax=Salinisphaera sp. LB1 TaxID=2183911 RepID=UPI000D7DB93A|nr:phospholipase D-like domain-containing protein [Salinisphaera sp. LB1]AWN17266.1 Phospholipase D/Transphosphatidylase precursor [Salinisphaera sp. LB1]
MRIDRHVAQAVMGLLGMVIHTTAVAAPASAPSIAPAHIQIVESVPKHSIYGEPGLARTPDVWRAMIESAHHRIDIAAFYVADKPGEALAPVMHAIADRAKAGVEIRILTGPTFASETNKSLAPLAKLANVTIQRLPVDRLTGGVLHAKYFVVDGHAAFIGSANWDWRAMNQIHELGARIDSPRMARTLDATFDFDWRLAADGDLPAARKRAAEPPTFEPVTRQAPVPVANANGRLTGTAFEAFSPPTLMPDWITTEQSALVQLIRSARHDVHLQVMTLSAINEYGANGYWPVLDTALRDAAARGVTVQIVVADWALRQPMQAYLKSLAVLPNITVKYSHVPAAPRGFIPYARVEHCKYAVADGNALYIGTGNWTRSYFDASVDAALFMHDADTAHTLNDIFERDWNGPYVHTIEPGGHYNPPRTH